MKSWTFEPGLSACLCSLAERRALYVATKRENPQAPVAETPGQSMSWTEY